MNQTPVGGFSHQRRLYAFVISENATTYLASASDPSQEFDLHYRISSGGPPANKFWQIASCTVDNARVPGLPDSSGKGLLLWGIGAGNVVSLAYMKLPAGDLPSSSFPPPEMPLRYYTGETSLRWSAVGSQDSALPLVEAFPVGQIGVSWIPGLDRWLMLYSKANKGLHPETVRKPVVYRIGSSPWSWFQEQVLFDPMAGDDYPPWMHREGRDDGIDRIPPRNRGDGWLYSPLLLDRYTSWDSWNQVATVHFLMSTNNPYQVMLMRAHLDRVPLGIRGEVRWSRRYFDATGLGVSQLGAELDIVVNRVELVPQEPPFAPTERLVRLQSASIVSLHEDSGDFVVHYETGKLSVSVPLRISVHVGSAFNGHGILSVSQTGGAHTVLLSDDAPWVDGVNFRLTFSVLH